MRYADRAPLHYTYTIVTHSSISPVPYSFILSRGLYTAMASQTDSHKPIPAWLSACLPTGDAVDRWTNLKEINREGVNPENVWWIEVGGRDGSRLAAVAKAFPYFPARMILQNTSAVLEAAPKIEGVEMMAHDILTEQPVHSMSSTQYNALY